MPKVKMPARRSLLFGGLSLAALAWLRPAEYQGGHTAYFARLNASLRAEGIDRPVLVIDLDRLDRNIDRVVASARKGVRRNFRIVVKSVPSPALVDYIAARAGTESCMVFHRPFVERMAELRPSADLLLGKPMPAAAMATFYRRHRGRFDPAKQLQWLIDTPQRLAQYLDFAQAQGLNLQVNLEIDVGLHRGGFSDVGALAGALRTIAEHPRHLVFSGFMGYDAHVKELPGLLARREIARVKERYRAFIEVLRQGFPDLAARQLCFNGAGSPTFRNYEDNSPINDISVGSALVKPGQFELPSLAEFEPAAFIATPVLKRQAAEGVPTMEWLAGPMAVWDRNCADLLFVYGGNWLAQAESPPGVRRSGLYASSNQEGYYAARGVPLAVDDFLFLRPAQSEAVLLQFGDLVAVRDRRIEARWPVLAVDS